jgi:hypothetical protein
MGLSDWLNRPFGRKVRGDTEWPLSGWKLVEQRQEVTVWQDPEGDVLTLTRGVALDFPELSDEDAVRRHCRELAESTNSGLIQADVVTAADEPAVMWVSKQHDGQNFVFTGMLVVAPASETASAWMMVTREGSITGLREAVVTNMFMSQGEITQEKLKSYMASFAHDPYDASYAGVDRQRLRFLSDDESYDRLLPQHPLSKLRRELRRLLTVKLGPAASPGDD